MIFSAIRKPKQQIILDEICEGLVIDIGGGGEGVIGQDLGARVIALDKFQSEIWEAKRKAPDVSWIVADAMKAPFGGERFDQATAFFCCMYMSDETKERVFRETHRVLKDGCELWIWDAQMDREEKDFGIRLQVELQNGNKISTVYGVMAKNQSARSISKQLKDVGFETKIIEQHNHWFMIKAKCKK